MKVRVLYAVAGVAAGALLWAGFVTPRLVDNSPEQRRILTAAGWLKIRSAAGRKLVELAQSIDTAPLEEAGAEIAAAGNWQTAPEIIYLPTTCPPQESPPSSGHTEEPLPDPAAGAAPHLFMQLEGQFVVGLTDKRDAYATGRVWADLRTSDWSERREFQIDRANVALSSDVHRALRRGTGPRVSLVPRPFGQWRAGWVLGAGACARVDYSLTPCAFAGYAVQF